MASQTEHEVIFKRIRLAICSANRREILLALKYGKKSLGILREEVHANPATIVHALRELERYRLVEEDDLRNYSLTVIGKALSQKVMECERLSEVLTAHEAFWFEHDVSGIPDYLFSRIGLLRNSVLVADGQGQVLRGLTTFIELIQQAHVLKIITPFYSTEFVDRLGVFTSKDKVWSFIVTEEVLQSAFIDEEEHANVKAMLQGDAEFRVLRQDPKLFFCSTGDAIMLALANTKGQLDYSTLFISRGHEPMAWGRELWHFYTERSEPVVINERLVSA
jgi:predicted transcriptional regulator